MSDSLMAICVGASAIVTVFLVVLAFMAWVIRGPQWSFYMAGALGFVFVAHELGRHIMMVKQ